MGNFWWYLLCFAICSRKRCCNLSLSLSLSFKLAVCSAINGKGPTGARECDSMQSTLNKRRRRRTLEQLIMQKFESLSLPKEDWEARLSRHISALQTGSNCRQPRKARLVYRQFPTKCNRATGQQANWALMMKASHLSERAHCKLHDDYSQHSLGAACTYERIFKWTSQKSTSMSACFRSTLRFLLVPIFQFHFRNACKASAVANFRGI